MKFFNRFAHWLAGSYSRPAIKIPKSMAMTFGPTVPDISFYQDDDATPQKVDFLKMRTGGAAGVIIRAGQNTWADEDFPDYWRSAKGILPRGVYWFYDSRATPQTQATLLANALLAFTDDLPEMEVFIDFEESYGGAYAGWRNLKSMLELMKIKIPGIKLGVYTGYYYWINNSPNPLTEPAALAYFKQYPLWLAWYTTDPAIVRVPAPWDKPLFWQYTDSGSGKVFGVESLDIDLSRFNGTPDEFNARYQETIPVPSPIVTVSDVRTDGVLIDGVVTGKWQLYTGVQGEFSVNQTSPTPPPVPGDGGQVDPPADAVHNLYWVRPRYVPGGPAIVVCSDAPKQTNIVIPLAADWQAFIKRLNDNDPKRWGVFADPAIGPSKGIDPVSGKLKYIMATWSGNVVRKVGESGIWTKIDSIPLTNPPAFGWTSRPWLVHTMTQVDAKLNFVSVSEVRDRVRDPIISKTGECWLQTEMLMPLETCTVYTNLGADPVLVTSVLGDLQGRLWGKINGRWFILWDNGVSKVTWHLAGTN